MFNTHFVFRSKDNDGGSSTVKAPISLIFFVQVLIALSFSII